MSLKKEIDIDKYAERAAVSLIMTCAAMLGMLTGWFAVIFFAALTVFYFFKI